MVTILTIAGSVLAVTYAIFSPKIISQGKLYYDVKSMPDFEYAMVFGTSDRIGDRENLFFKYRMEAVARLWKAKKFKRIILSGDHSSRYYNEPQKMKVSLLELGVPETAMLLDPKGFSTYESVENCAQVFHLKKILFVSQAFQNERALYLASKFKLDAYGYNARHVPIRLAPKTYIREIAARMKMLLDAHVIAPKSLDQKAPQSK